MSYLEKHKASGLMVGDKVRVFQSAYHRERGWDNVWAPEMDDWVGTVGEISEDKEDAGFRVDAMGDFWDFPYFVLEKVED